ncbi:MAG TPA: Fe-S cluster assembly protein SufD [Bacteroidia bacterium]|nr:Fe-S cluster assembly protein SufD [Bacteroidia bacterium]
MSTVAEKNPVAEKLMEGFPGKLPSLSGDAKVRRHAADVFLAAGIPTRKWEDYKYLHPEALFKKEFHGTPSVSRMVTEHDVKEMLIAPSAIRVVLVNGVFSAELSPKKNQPDGIVIMDLADAIVSSETAKKHYAKYATAEKDPFIAWNTALNEGGVFIHFPAGAKMQEPVHIIHIASNEVSSVCHPRILIVAENGCEALIIESYESIGPVKTFTNAVTEVFAAEHTKVHHYRVQAEGENAHQLNSLHALTQKGSNYSNYTFSFGGAWVRNNTNVVFSQPFSEAHLFGLYLPGGKSVVDNHTVVDHAVPDCMSNELFKGIVNGKSTAVFNGKIFVRPDAQRTNAFQTNRNILLSDDATVNTKPQLEIYADDVKCSHGTSTGRLNDEALFYLRARGIGEDNARKLLVRAFAEEVVEKVELKELRGYIDSRIDDLLA